MGKSALVMPQINLARKQGNFIDTFLHWALTSGRLIIIITETIALSAFVMRFSLDRQIIDLHDKIKTQKIYIEAFQHQENTYRNLQDRLSLIRTLEAQAQNQKTKFFSLLAVFPEDVQLNTFDVTGNSLKMDVAVRTTTSLDTLIQKVRAQQTVSDVTITKIDNKVSEGTIGVTLTAAIK